MDPRELSRERYIVLARSSVLNGTVVRDMGKSLVFQSPCRPALETEGVIGGSGCDPDAISLEAKELRRAYETSRGGMMRSYAEGVSCRLELIRATSARSMSRTAAFAATTA